MPKLLMPHWRLHEMVREVVRRLAPDSIIIPCVQHDDQQIMWDEECEGVGRASWYVGYIVPEASARALVPILNAAMAPLQARYDLGLTCD